MKPTPREVEISEIARVAHPTLPRSWNFERNDRNLPTHNGQDHTSPLEML